MMMTESAVDIALIRSVLGKDGEENYNLEGKHVYREEEEEVKKYLEELMEFNAGMGSKEGQAWDA